MNDEVNALLDAAGLALHFRTETSDDNMPVTTLNSPSTDSLHDDFVLRNRPVLLRCALNDWPPVRKWCDDAYLRDAAPTAMVAARRVSAESGSSIDALHYETDTVSWPALVDSLSEGPAHAAHYAAQVRRGHTCVRVALPLAFMHAHADRFMWRVRVSCCLTHAAPIAHDAPSAVC